MTSALKLFGDHLERDGLTLAQAHAVFAAVRFVLEEGKTVTLPEIGTLRTRKKRVWAVPFQPGKGAVEITLVQLQHPATLSRVPYEPS